jgi:hypothetical protein
VIIYDSFYCNKYILVLFHKPCAPGGGIEVDETDHKDDANQCDFVDVLQNCLMQPKLSFFCMCVRERSCGDVNFPK